MSKKKQKWPKVIKLLAESSQKLVKLCLKMVEKW
jgi:hypothetical protein